MNGRLHLGHAFSLTKAEFTARFQRMLGKNVLFPFGFHCTGMPIQAAAVKLQEEINEFGCPPNFPLDTVQEHQIEKESEEPVNKSKGKKTKLAVKGHTGAKVRQWDILSKMVPEEEISKFTNPLTWLEYFPPLGLEDLKSFGSSVDWRRSFITTSINPYYDAFIRWQFNKLKEGGRIKRGYRPSIYSVKDQQVCADHDRASGEGVGPQEYVLIKLKIIDFSNHKSLLNNSDLQNTPVYLVAATLRPETMYGQTNCFVLPEGDYGAYLFKPNEVYIMSERSAIGLAHQGPASNWGQIVCLGKFKGMELIGLPLEPPLAYYRRVYVLPLITISMSKGTGVVTSVPSDAPDDYIALKELKEKPLWREKFGVSASMVSSYNPLPIIGM
jgi:leucyl-tRNA synthetase